MTTLELDNETAALLAEMAEQEPEQFVKDLIKRHSENRHVLTPLDFTNNTNPLPSLMV